MLALVLITEEGWNGNTKGVNGFYQSYVYKESSNNLIHSDLDNNI